MNKMSQASFNQSVFQMRGTHRGRPYVSRTAIQNVRKTNAKYPITYLLKLCRYSSLSGQSLALFKVILGKIYLFISINVISMLKYLFCINKIRESIIFGGILLQIYHILGRRGMK